jgi:hypothetical protein
MPSDYRSWKMAFPGRLPIDKFTVFGSASLHDILAVDLDNHGHVPVAHHASNPERALSAGERNGFLLLVCAVCGPHWLWGYREGPLGHFGRDAIGRRLRQKP